MQLVLFKRKDQPPQFDHVWYWTARPYAFRDGAYHRMNRKGHKCRVLKRGAMGSVLVEFEDGYRVCTSRYAVRKA